METVKAFLLGVWEFRSSWTTRVADAYSHAYDAGRELAHRVTLRRYEQ